MNNVVLRKAMINVIGIVGITVCSSALQAASFDCSKASTNVEKLICMDAIISQQDEQLEQVYKVALGKIVDEESLRREQRTWLKRKRNACKDAMCLMQVYHERIAQLNSLNMITPSDARVVQISASGPAQFNLAESEAPSAGRKVNHKFPLQFKLVFGDSYPLCQPYVDMLNKTKYMEYPSCERKLLPEFKQFKAIEWSEITDKKEVEKIMDQLIRLDVVRDNEIDSLHHQRVWKRAKERMDSGSSRYYFSKFDFETDGEDETLYKETVKLPRRQKNSLCKYENFYDVEDKKLSVENIVKHSIDPYMMLEGLHAHLFIFHGKVINSIWQPYGNNYSIELWTSNSHPALCKIVIQ